MRPWRTTHFSKMVGKSDEDLHRTQQTSNTRYINQNNNYVRSFLIEGAACKENRKIPKESEESAESTGNKKKTANLPSPALCACAVKD